MAKKLTTKNSSMTKIVRIADAASWGCALVFVTLVLIGASKDISPLMYDPMKPNQYPRNRPCDEIYVVGEGESLHTISDKCGDPFIVERNPHIHDPDDVYPGLVIKITPATNT